MSLVATLLPPLGALPTELVNLPHWLGWRAQVRAGKRTKVPISPRTGRLASSTDPATWTTFDVAASFAEQSHCDGVGFVFTHSPYVGIDLDHCIDPRSGELEAWAMAIVERFASYTEISPSGTGLHIIVKGELPEGRKKKHVDGGHPNAAIEVYDTGRYFTITGRHLGGIPFDIVEASDLAAWHAETFPAPPPEERERTEPASTPS
jgi:putative DNA primase/helicase